MKIPPALIETIPYYIIEQFTILNIYSSWWRFFEQYSWVLCQRCCVGRASQLWCRNCISIIHGYSKIMWECHLLPLVKSWPETHQMAAVLSNAGSSEYKIVLYCSYSTLLYSWKITLHFFMTENKIAVSFPLKFHWEAFHMENSITW